ncbi:glutamate carboxypeptidase [Sphingobium sp. OAS761]|uniref:hydrolase n=1 Tax=Sphingobium sp. OAS761 TaxID=2817901 RepID=UPI0020A0879F|nr:hydrolase [Sphingobium sp. OAS761]MCP1469851.1 glutamate carboxypeptidase [Sphingobium sp. OAS761]
MPNLSHAEKAALDRVTDAPMLAQVQQWAAVNSGSRNLQGLAEMAGLLADAFAALPGDVTLLDPAPVDAVAADGRVDLIAHGRHLHLAVRPDAPVRLLLTGHMDTVFGIDHPFQKQRWQEPGILNGPGVADMKGGIAVMLAALLALEGGPETPNFGYDVVINSDEEVGSPSSAALLRRIAMGKAAAFTYEPALPDGTLAGARAGSGNFSIIVTGRSAHAGRNPQDGRNALVAAADLALRLKRGSGSGFSCNPARIDGGGPNNVVPDHAILRVNFRPRSAEDERAARDLLDRTIADIAHEHDVELHCHGGFGRPPKPMDERTGRLFDLVRRCGADLGVPIAWRDTGGVCDGNNIAACGIAVVDTMGVRGGSIHSDAEFLIADSLVERARLSTLTLMRVAHEKI